MVFEFKFPDVGEGITEGEIVKWKVKEGDKVEADQPLVEIETDKAVVNIPSPKAGTILKINHKEGETINVGEVLLEIGEEGEKAPAKPKPVKAEAPKPKPEKKAKVDAPYTGSVVGFLEEAPDEEETEKKQAVHKVAHKKVMATPVIRALARTLNIDISTIQGTGPQGRITEDDIKKATGQAPKPAEAKPAAPATHAKVVRKYDIWGYVDRIPLKGLRKHIAKHMYDAHTKSVPITNMHDVDVTGLWKLRQKEKKVAEKKGVHLTFMPFIIKAVMKAFEDHPVINSTLEGDEIVIKKYYNIGVAVSTPEGLIVPVIKRADQKDIFQLAGEITILAGKAKQRKVDMMDLKGGSFTITNLGSVGVKYFTPMINYPEASILGVGRIEERARADSGKVVVKKMLPLSFTYDHRIIDGSEAAAFMLDVINYLENPALIFIQDKEKKK